MSDKKTVCVDLDGTLATYGHWVGVDHIGEARPGAAEFMANLRQRYRVVVFTTRTKADMPGRGEDYERAVVERGHDLTHAEFVDWLAAKVEAWLAVNGIEYDEVYRGQGKPIAVAYVDDRAVELPSNPGAFDFANALLRVAQVDR